MKLFEKRDILYICGLFFCAISIFFALLALSEFGTTAEVWYDNELILTISLIGVKHEYQNPQNPEISFLRSRTGTIAFSRSNCPDKICVNTGFLSEKGQVAACLPNKTILKIAGAERR